MKEIRKGQEERDLKLQLIGWILFVLCAVLFLASSVKNRDVLTFIGSVFFLVSCFFFIIPLVERMQHRGE